MQCEFDGNSTDNLLPTVSVKELRKSVSICSRYGKNTLTTFFFGPLYLRVRTTLKITK